LIFAAMSAWHFVQSSVVVATRRAFPRRRAARGRRGTRPSRRGRAGRDAGPRRRPTDGSSRRVRAAFFFSMAGSADWCGSWQAWQLPERNGGWSSFPGPPCRAWRGRGGRCRGSASPSGRLIGGVRRVAAEAILLRGRRMDACRGGELLGDRVVAGRHIDPSAVRVSFSLSLPCGSWHEAHLPSVKPRASRASSGRPRPRRGSRRRARRAS